MESSENFKITTNTERVDTFMYVRGIMKSKWFYKDEISETIARNKKIV